jgi:predicted HTH transcriptional regulator
MRSTKSDITDNKVIDGYLFQKVLELAKGRPVRTSDLSEIFPDVNERTIRRDLNAMADNGILEAKGKTKNRYYILKE